MSIKKIKSIPKHSREMRKADLRGQLTLPSVILQVLLKREFPPQNTIRTALKSIKKALRILEKL